MTTTTTKQKYNNKKYLFQTVQSSLLYYCIDYNIIFVQMLTLYKVRIKQIRLGTLLFQFTLLQKQFCSTVFRFFHSHTNTKVAKRACSMHKNIMLRVKHKFYCVKVHQYQHIIVCHIFYFTAFSYRLYPTLGTIFVSFSFVLRKISPDFDRFVKFIFHCKNGEMCSCWENPSYIFLSVLAILSLDFRVG